MPRNAPCSGRLVPGVNTTKAEPLDEKSVSLGLRSKALGQRGPLPPVAAVLVTAWHSPARSGGPPHRKCAVTPPEASCTAMIGFQRFHQLPRGDLARETQQQPIVVGDEPATGCGELRRRKEANAHEDRARPPTPDRRSVARLAEWRDVPNFDRRPKPKRRRSRRARRRMPTPRCGRHRARSRKDRGGGCTTRSAQS
jgi:hypothetical protein